MPRKIPLPQDELEIGKRVRIVRERRALSRAAFARELGVDGSVIANVEHGRSPLRFDLGQKICERFGKSQRWLATGLLPADYAMHFYGFDSRIPPRTPFREAYLEFLGGLSEKAVKQAAERAGCRVEELDDFARSKSLAAVHPESAEAISRRKQVLMQWAANVLDLLPVPLHEKFLGLIAAMDEKFQRDHKRAIDKHRKTRFAKLSGMEA